MGRFEVVRLGKAKIWSIGKSKALHLPKWWVREYAQNGEVNLYIDAEGRLIVEPVEGGGN